MKESNSINYSIIIPHKNIPELLSRCLQSIPYRNDIQVIIVDDNSDEKKVDFNSFPGFNRPDTEIYFTKEGKGAGYARNIGLNKAKGKWIIFADADDYFNGCINNVLDTYKDQEADIIYFQTNSVYNDTLEETESRGIFYNNWIKESIKRSEVIENVKYRIHPPWGKFFSHKLIKENNIEFDEVLSSNDVMFSTKSGYYANKILVDINFLYCSTIRQNSLEFTVTKAHITPRFYIALRQYCFLLSVSKEKYRINIWEFIYKLREIDNKNTKYYIKDCIKTMKLKHLVMDFFLFKLIHIIGLFKQQKLSHK